ncbi:hypothetical protein SAMN05216257_101548 [Meinhardsimonia xiamenensis]|jgi:hypothetical protein|uniref:Uncharacterized protein n=1 Tax=Meinhardsimonia xiamenensis TaxID=990712 RepID=A0A1G8Z3J3_9RHOB|nr:hypothetical protein [Meinhardsimonia xiamenensis]PRX37524.1 hypothetical protein LV81_01303 [Meinhardsimonia xiamenensis]SDK09194.1 hypothetical protein SAMN05216257_101548 [Meinhardsimonia xiamenensis]
MPALAALACPPVPALSRDEIDRRVTFHDDIEVMELDFSGLRLGSAAEVNAFYDRVEERIAETGEGKWFLLVNYSGSRVEPEAWFAFSRRGRELNLAHSMGTVRVDDSEETRRQIARDAGTERFDPNLFADRASALARLGEMPSKRLRRIVHEPTHTREEIAARVRFLEAQEIMEVDLGGFEFRHSRDVNDFFDYLEEEITRSGRRWYFLVNYGEVRIWPEAWVPWAVRSKRLVEGGGLGAVRYGAGADVEAEIRLHAQGQGVRANVRATRAEALARIAEMKAEAARARPGAQLSQRLRRR